MFRVGAHTDYKLDRAAAIEIVALYLFRLADRHGQLITRAWADRRLEELRAHPLTCRCGAPCRTARDLPGAKVWWCASTWQRSIAESRRLARR
jgi:hypothetical protein